MTVAIAMAPAMASPSDEAEFVALINQTRTGAGLTPLENYGDLVDDARRHTADMIAEGKIFHSTTSQLSSATSGWSQLGENVGMGPNPSILHAAFMGSPSHKANILGAYDRVGVGADRAADGTMFVTVIFMQTAAAPTTTTTAPPATTTTTTTAPPPPPTTSTTVPASAPPATSSSPTAATPVAAAPTSTTAAAAPANSQVIELVAPTRSGRSDAAWIELEALAGAYCVTVRVEGSVCVE